MAKKRKRKLKRRLPVLYMSVSHKKAPPGRHYPSAPSLYFDPDTATALAQPNEPGTGKQFVFEVTLGVLVDDLGEFYRHMSPERDPERILDLLTYIAEQFHVPTNGAPKKTDCPMWEAWVAAGKPGNKSKFVAEYRGITEKDPFRRRELIRTALTQLAREIKRAASWTLIREN